jgi:rSAM/selenodomain-associated transferase 2
VALLGVVIPTLNEADNIPGILADLHELDIDTDVLVVDGGSEDTTSDMVRRAGARVVTAPAGRGRQLRAGAEQVEGEWLCFLHADVRMGDEAREGLRRTVADPHVAAAVWRLRIGARGAWFRLVELGARVRDHLGGLPYGDQGLLVRREAYDAAGGFQPIPVMEDVALIRELRCGVRIHRLDASLEVSPRRWQREGQYRTWMRNVALLSAYRAGVSPEKLARWYRPEPR